MNKKLLSFLSLFCLTLVLSVYYVVVPYNGAIKDGFFGLFSGMFLTVISGITLAIVLSVVAALFFKPKD